MIGWRGWGRPRPGLLALLTLLGAPALLGAEGGSDLPRLFLVVAAMLAAAKLGGEAAERVGLPAVLGELLAGLLLGPGALAVMPAVGQPGAETILVLAEFGVVLLLFEVGLETDLKEMLRVGPAAGAVASVGVAVPFLLGYLYWAFLPHPAMGDHGSLTTVAIFIGATLTATSVGITARVLGDLGRIDTPEARIVLGAAVLDDIIGLVILSVVSGIAAGGAFSLMGIVTTFAVAVGFLVLVVGVGHRLMPRVADRVVRMRVRGVVVALSLAFALALAAFAARVGSALIIGAFAAGLILRSTRHGHTVGQEMRPLAATLAPLFFVNVGAAADLSLLDPRAPGAEALLLVTGVLTLLAVAGKFVAGWAAPWARYRRVVVGVGMIPRGEVGLIFAEIGRRAGLLGEATFSAVLLTVMATTFVAPLGLKLLFQRTPRP